MANSESSIHNIEKIGNLIIYLVDEIKKKYKRQLYLTKLLKLLYIIDETAVKETSVPITGLTYKAWKMGPVAYDVYKDLQYEKSDQLSFYVEAKKPKGDSNDWALINSVNKFDDSEFSDYEINLIDRVIDDYGAYDKDQLIELLHEDGSLWKQVVDENHLQKIFETENTSQYKIDLSLLLAGDKHKLELFRNAQDSLKL